MSLNLAGRSCVVIGARDDREAIEKSAALHEAGAQVRWIDDVEHLRDEDLTDAFFVISTPQDAELSARLRALADRHRFLLCCIDQPTYGFVAMTALAKAGPVQIAISTAGLAPRVGKAFKLALQRIMDAKFERFVACLATLRLRVQASHPRPEDSAYRRQAMIGAAEGFSVEVALRYPEWFEDEVANTNAQVLKKEP